MKRYLTFCVLAVVVAVGFAGPARAQSDPRIGTWTLNVAKSKYTPGPPPVSETRTYATQGHDTQVSVESVDGKGNHASLRYAANDDGKDYPLTGLAFANAVATRRRGPNAFEADTKMNGKIIGTTRGEISKDGKVLTLTTKTVGPNGQAITNVAVYNKH